MAMPAGFSSDEEDFDGFRDYSTSKSKQKNYGKSRNNYFQPIQPEVDLKEKLYYALVCGDFETVKSSIESGTDVNLQLKDNSPLLLIAASVGNPEISEFLLEKGADPNGNKDQYTPLMAACSCPAGTSSFDNVVKVVSKLLEHKADVDAINRKRITPFMFAANAGNVEVVKMLGPLVKDKEMEDNQGWTALFWAVNGGHPEVVKELLIAGLKPEKIDVRINTPLDYALSNEYEEIIKLLPAKKTAKDIYVVQEQLYDLDTIFCTKDLNSNRPQFKRDIWCLLYGMRCEYLKDFENSEMDLFHFLIANEEDLKKEGVHLPYQRCRILQGLFRFHNSSYTRNSVPVVQQYDIYSTNDVAKAILAAVRHCIVMEASLKYLEVKASENLWKDPVINQKLTAVKGHINKLKRIHMLLEQKTHKWDKENEPVDLILKTSKRRKSRLFKWVSIIGVASVVLIVVQKNSLRLL